MVSCLFNAKPLSEPTLTYCQFDNHLQFSVTFLTKYNTFLWTKCIGKCHLQNLGYLRYIYLFDALFTIEIVITSYKNEKQIPRVKHQLLFYGFKSGCWFGKLNILLWFLYADSFVYLQLMMSWHGTAFHITGLLLGESTSYWWIPLTNGPVMPLVNSPHKGSVMQKVSPFHIKIDENEGEKDCFDLLQCCTFDLAISAFLCFKEIILICESSPYV